PPPPLPHTLGPPRQLPPSPLCPRAPRRATSAAAGVGKAGGNPDASCCTGQAGRGKLTAYRRCQRRAALKKRNYIWVFMKKRNLLFLAQEGAAGGLSKCHIFACPSCWVAA